MEREEVAIKLREENVTLEGTWTTPKGANILVVFAHGSGSGRFSPRNQFVAGVLQKHKLATLLFDLLTKEEEAQDNLTGELRFNIDFLAKRLIGVLRWLNARSALKLALFGASTGAAAALQAAAELKELVYKVVSRGGRPDLAAPFLPEVKAPTLLLVGGADYGVIELNQQALALLRCEKKLLLIPGATHLFEEEGALEEVARLATEWLKD